MKKYMYKPSPRMEMFKLKKLSKKFKSFSKDKRIENDFLSLEKCKPPINNQNSNNNSNNLTSNSINKIEPEKVNKEFPIDQPKFINNIQTLRKSIVDNAEDTNKRNPSMNNIKPIVFKKLTKNINGKLSIFTSKLKRCESQSSASNIRTNENI